MAAQSIDTGDRSVQGTPRALRSRPDTATHVVGYRLDVFAATVVDVVEFAGGWLFDRMRAGWNVTVLVAEHPDERPLQILGAQIMDLEYALTSVGPRSRPQTLAVAADLLECDSRVRQRVLQALGGGVTEVALWGETSRAELDDNCVAVVEHRLSAVARAFKAQALTAAGVVSPFAGPAETFRRGGTRRRSVAGDLIPARQEVSPLFGCAV